MAAPILMNMLQQRMTTERDILTLAQWLSPAFPVGGFAYSHGLETAISRGVITSADDLEGWLMDLLAYGSGRNDCVLLRAGYACDTVAGLADVHEIALAASASRERILETHLQGTAFSMTTSAIFGDESIALCYPVAVGAAAARAQIDLDLVAAFYLHAFAGNLVSAAVRAVPLGQTDGQKVLAALIPLCDRIAKETRDDTLEALHSTAFASDIAAMQHETLQPRIFRS